MTCAVFSLDKKKKKTFDFDKEIRQVNFYQSIFFLFYNMIHNQHLRTNTIQFYHKLKHEKIAVGGIQT